MINQVRKRAVWRLRTGRPGCRYPDKHQRRSPRQAHNLKVIGSNPIPATRHQALENKSFSRAFCCPNFGLKFRSWKRRGSGRRKVAARNRRSRARRNDSIVIGGALRVPPSTPRFCVGRQRPNTRPATRTRRSCPREPRSEICNLRGPKPMDARIRARVD
jgi:hypothetical protein